MTADLLIKPIIDIVIRLKVYQQKHYPLFHPLA